MFLQRPIDQVVEQPFLHIPLDLLIPKPLGILQQPDAEAGQLISGQLLGLLFLF